MSKMTTMIEELSKKVYDAKAAARKLVTEVMKEKETHYFSEPITKGYYRIDEYVVYFSSATYKDGVVTFNCIDFDGEEMNFTFDEFEQDDMTFFDIAYDIMEAV